MAEDGSDSEGDTGSVSSCRGTEMHVKPLRTWVLKHHLHSRHVAYGDSGQSEPRGKMETRLNYVITGELEPHLERLTWFCVHGGETESHDLIRRMCLHPFVDDKHKLDIFRLPLLTASKYGRFGILKCILDNLPTSNIVNTHQSGCLSTPTILAARYAPHTRKLDFITNLLNYRGNGHAAVDICAVDEKGMTALMHAAASPHSSKVIQTILDYAGESNLHFMKCRNMKTAFLYAVEAASASNIEALLVSESHHSANVIEENRYDDTDTEDDEDEYSVSDSDDEFEKAAQAAYRASDFGNYESEEESEEEEEVPDAMVMTRIDVGAREAFFGFGALSLLLQKKGKKEDELLALVQLLVTKNCSVNQKDNNGFTALHHCANRNFSSICRYLMSDPANADMNAKDKNGHTPLRVAIEKRHFNTARTLLRIHGTNGRLRPVLPHQFCRVDLEDNWGCTALMYAAKMGDLEAIGLLIDAGASLSKKCKKGDTAIDMASRFFQDRAVKALSSAEANLKLISNLRRHVAEAEMWWPPDIETLEHAMDAVKEAKYSATSYHSPEALLSFTTDILFNLRNKVVIENDLKGLMEAEDITEVYDEINKGVAAAEIMGMDESWNVTVRTAKEKLEENKFLMAELAARVRRRVRKK